MKAKGEMPKRTRAKVTASTKLGERDCAGIVYAETGVLTAATTPTKAALQDGRRFIAGVAYKRDGTGTAKPKFPTPDELKMPAVKAAWESCEKAAKDAAGDNVLTCKHFVIWFSDDSGKTPSKQPKRIKDDWPYDQSAKIKESYGPFTCPIDPPKGSNIYIIKYCGVP